MIYFLLFYCIIGAIHHFLFYQVDKQVGALDKISPSLRFACAISWIFTDFMIILFIIIKYIAIKKYKSTKKGK